ncbi:MAG: DnaJ domain-containing protein [Akkermansiaceae bacterium]|nr:DnaJ domain-containing protein [Armatimonadota bacterium]
MPSGPQNSRTYYEILGVNRTASADEIKTAYRKLARTLHPDVNPGDPQASTKFADVTTAYKALADSLSRANYDAEQSLKERRADAARTRAGGATSSATYGTPPPRPGASPTPNSQNPAPFTGDEAARLVTTARAALSRMRFVEARELAQRSLRIKRSAEGYEVLGDVYRMQGRVDEAVNMYTMSLQLNPRNAAMMERLQRLARADNSTTRREDVRRNQTRDSNAAAARQTVPSSTPYDSYTPRAGSIGAGIMPEKRPLLKAFAMIVGYGTTFFLLMAMILFLQEAPTGSGPLPLAIVSKWSGGVLAVLMGCGLILGWTMTVTGAVRRLDDELVFSRGQSGFVPPMGPVLLVLSAVSFWAAALVHVLLTLLQEGRVAGILRAFGAVAVVVLVAGIFYDADGRGQILLWGGNVVFLSYVFGWFIGDLFRTD